MAIPTILANFDGNLTAATRSGSVTLTTAGPVRYGAGAYGYSSKYNFLVNPEATTNTIQIAAVGSTAMERVTNRYSVNPRGTAVRVTTASAATDGVIFTSGTAPGIAFPNGGSVIGSVYLEGDGVTPWYLWTRVVYTDGTQESDLTSRVTITPTEGRYSSGSVSINPAKPVWYIQVHIRVPTANPGNVLYASRAQIETGTTVTPYINRLNGPGYGSVGANDTTAHYRESWVFGGRYISEESTTNLVPDGRVSQTAQDTTVGWDNALNGTTVPLYVGTVGGWANGYNGGVADPAIGYHAHINPTGGPDGSPCWEFINENAQFGHAGRWMAATWTSKPQNTLGITAGGNVTLSADLKKASTGPFLRIVPWYYDTAGVRKAAAPLPDITPSIVGDWQRVSVTFTVPADYDAANTTGVMSLYIYGHYSPEGRLWMDNVQVEAKAYATSFTPQFDRTGTILPGYTWSGAAYQSHITRASASVIVATSASVPTYVSPTTGAYVVRIRTNKLAADPKGNRYIIGLGTYGTSDFISLLFPNGRPRAWLRSGTTADRILDSTTTAVTDTQYTTIYMGWNATTLTLKQDATYSGSRSDLFARVGNFGSSSLRLGSDINGGQQGNIDIDGVYIFQRELTDDEWNEVRTAETWEWNTLIPVLGGITQLPDAASLGISVLPDNAVFGITQTGDTP